MTSALSHGPDCGWPLRDGGLPPSRRVGKGRVMIEATVDVLVHFHSFFNCGLLNQG